MWKETTLGEICEFVRGPFGGSLKKNIFVKEGYAVYEQQHAINNQCKNFRYYINQEKFLEMQRFIVKSGDILMSCSGTIGKTTIVPEDAPVGIINQALLKITTSNVLNIHFLKFYMQSKLFHGQLMETVDGAAIKNVASVKILKNITINLPPLAEQQRIVAKLDAAFAEIDEAIDAVESKESEVQALKTSILNKLLNSKSNGWETSSLGDVSSFISRGISPKYLESGGVRVLNQKCIRNHHINFDLARRHDIDLKKVSEERFIRLGDILINSTGQGTLGRVAQVRKEPDELTTIDSHITIVRPKSEVFYLDYFGYAAIAIEKIIQDAGQGTSGQTELAKSKVQNDFQICFPHSFSEQEAEVKKLDMVFKETEIAFTNFIKSKTNLYALKSAILSQELKSSEAA